VVITNDSLRLGNNLLALGEDKLDVAGVGHVGVDLSVLLAWYWTTGSSCLLSGWMFTYTTVSTVGAAALLGGLVDLDVLDDQVASVETLGIGVGLGVLEEAEEELGGLHGPAGTGNAPLLACLFESRSATVSQKTVIVSVARCSARPNTPQIFPSLQQPMR